MKKLGLVTVGVLVGLVGCAGPSTRGTDDVFEFALIGDNPTQPANEPKYARLIDEINRRPELRWVVHVGDMKGGGQSCDDAFLRERFDLNQRFEAPFVLTPGDNDWFDCGREGAGRFDPYERLSFLRRLFYPQPDLTTGRVPMRVVSQATDPEYAEFVENVRWRYGDVVFATLHLVGLNRGEAPTPADSRRLEAALAWLRSAFDEAQTTQSRGIFLATQVNPWVLSGMPPIVKMLCPTCSEVRPGLEPLHDELVRLAATFERPILMAVGDTHIFRVDKLLYDRESGNLVEHFTRLESFGNPFVHWVRVRIDGRSSGLFEIHQQLVDRNLGPR